MHASVGLFVSLGDVSSGEHHHHHHHHHHHLVLSYRGLHKEKISVSDAFLVQRDPSFPVCDSFTRFLSAFMPTKILVTHLSCWFGGEDSHSSELKMHGCSTTCYKLRAKDRQSIPMERVSNSITSLVLMMKIISLRRHHLH
jgi:hypothetical protein